VRQEGTAKGRVRKEAASPILICPDPSGPIADWGDGREEAQKAQRKKSFMRIMCFFAAEIHRGMRMSVLKTGGNGGAFSLFPLFAPVHSPPCGFPRRACGGESQLDRVPPCRWQYYTNSVCISCPAPAVFSRIFRLFAENWRKCLSINHLQLKSPVLQSSPIKPNQGKSCLIAPKRAIFAAASLSRSGRESSNPYCNDMDLKAETSKVFLQPPSRAISMAA
jgi:hypothetical protein